MGQASLEPGQDKIHVGAVLFIHRRIKANPEQIGFRADSLEVIGKGQSAFAKARLDEFFQARFADRRLALAEFVDQFGIDIESLDFKAFRATSGGDTAEVPESQDRRSHFFSSIHGLFCNHCNVRIMLSRMVIFGFQPVAWIFFVSKKMKGLSPIHPRSPPLNSSRGFKPRCPQIHPIESVTWKYSFVPRLYTSTWCRADLAVSNRMTCSMASRQSPTQRYDFF